MTDIATVTHEAPFVKIAREMGIPADEVWDKFYTIQPGIRTQRLDSEEKLGLSALVQLIADASPEALGIDHTEAKQLGARAAVFSKLIFTAIESFYGGLGEYFVKDMADRMVNAMHSGSKRFELQFQGIAQRMAAAEREATGTEFDESVMTDGEDRVKTGRNTYSRPDHLGGLQDQLDEVAAGLEEYEALLDISADRYRDLTGDTWISPDARQRRQPLSTPSQTASWMREQARPTFNPADYRRVAVFGAAKLTPDQTVALLRGLEATVELYGKVAVYTGDQTGAEKVALSWATKQRRDGNPVIHVPSFLDRKRFGQNAGYELARWVAGQAPHAVVLVGEVKGKALAIKREAEKAKLRIVTIE